MIQLLSGHHHLLEDSVVSGILWLRANVVSLRLLVWCLSVVSFFFGSSGFLSRILLSRLESLEP